MIEKLFEGGGRWAARQGSRLTGRASALPAGISISVLVCVLLGGRVLWVRAARPAHCGEIAAAFGSVGLVHGQVQPDHAGGRMTFVQQGEKGLGVFLCDTATGRKQVLEEEPGEGKPVSFQVWPWSPDDSLFIYSRSGFNMAICQGDTGKELARVGGLPTQLKELAWLTPEAFVCLGKRGEIGLVQKQKNGRWKRTALAQSAGASGNLTTLSTNTIAWRERSRIYTQSVTVSNQPSLLLDLKPAPPKWHTLNDFSYSRETGQFLLTCSYNRRPCLWRFVPASATTPEELAPIAGQEPVSDAVWLGGTNRASAWLWPRPENNSVAVSASPFATPVRLFANGNVDSFTAVPDGRQLFIVGVVSNEPSAGIWRYDLLSEQLRCIVPCSDRPSPWARHIEAHYAALKLPTGRVLNYCVCRPAGFERRQGGTYPLVIADTRYGLADMSSTNNPHAPLWAQAIANCGAYVVIVNRRDWFADIDKLGEDFMAVYRRMAQNPRVDLDQVFLVGVSAETKHMEDSLVKHPELWKGAMLLNPGVLPDLAALPPGRSAPKILVSFGELERREERIKGYQEQCLRNGAVLEYNTTKGATHYFKGTQALGERTQAMIRFIFED